MGEKGELLMIKCLKSKFMFLCMAALLTMLCGLKGGEALADTTKVDPSLSIDSSAVVISNGTSTPSPMSGGVRVTFDNAGDLVSGGSIVLEAPSGVRFDTANLPAIGFSGTADAAGDVTFTWPGSSTSITLTMPGTATTGSGFFTTNNTKFELVINAVTGTGTLHVGSSTAASASSVDRLNFLPTTSSANNDVNSPNLKLKATVNAGTTDASSIEGGDIDLLAEPRITDAVMVDTTTVDVTFNVDVGSSTAITGDPTAGAFIVNSVGTASAKAGGEAVVVAPTRPVSGNNKKVRVIAPTSFSDTAIPMIGIVQNLVANRDSSTTVPVLNTGATTVKMFPIKRSSTAAISSVTVDKTKVGARKEAGVNALSANKFSATVKVSPASQPVKLKLVRVSDLASNPAPLSTGSITTAAGTTQAVTNGLRAQIGGVAVGREDGTTGTLTAGYVRDAYNADVFVLTSSQLASGEATVDFILGNAEDAFAFDGELDGYRAEDASAAAATAIPVGNAVDIKVVASVDDFQTIVSSDAITVDKKGPVAITSGTNKVVAPTRSQVKVTFDESLADSTATDSSLWGVSDGSSGSAGVAAATYRKYPISSIALSDDKKTATINVSSLFTQGGSVEVGVHTRGTPTAGVGDVYYNPVFGTTTVPATYVTTTLTTIGTATAPIGDVQSLAAGPYAQGNLDLSNTSNVITFTLNADTNVLNTQLYVQAFDATGGFSTPQGSLRAGNALTANGGLDITESSAGVYTGRYVPYTGLSSSAVQLWIVASTSQPSSSADWFAAAKSNDINIDNTKPTVNSPAQYDAASNSATVQFSEGMNATVLATQSNFPVVRNLTAGGTIDVLSVIIASDKKQATYKLLQIPEDNVTYVVDFGAETTDDAGNPVINSDVAGIDRAEFTTVSTLPTPAPTATPTTTATPVVSPTPTPGVTTGSVEGQVTDADTEAAIQGATVTHLINPALTATTDAAGFYSISNVPAGDNPFSASATGYVQAVKAVTVTAGETAPLDFELSAVVVSTPTPTATPTPECPDEVEATTASVDPDTLTLAKGDSEDVIVLVTGDNECPAQGVKVKRKLTSANKKKIKVTPASAKTDENGEATFTVKAKKNKGKANVKFGVKGVKVTPKVNVSLSK